MKLNQTIRKVIGQKLIDRRFKLSVQAMIIEHMDIAEDIYQDYYTKKEQAKIQRTHKSYLKLSDYIKMSCRNKSSTWYFTSTHLSEKTGISVYGTKRKDHFFFDKDRRNLRIKVYTPGHPLFKRAEQYIQTKDLLFTEVRKVRNEIMKILKSAATIKDLVETWPQVKPFVMNYQEDEDEDQSIPLSANSISDMNKKLGLSV